MSLQQTCPSCYHSREAHDVACCYQFGASQCACPRFGGPNAPEDDRPLFGGMDVAQLGFPISTTAAKKVELAFNPNGRQDVQQIKLLAAALITAAEEVRDASSGEGPRRAARAITSFEDGSGLLVKALFA